MNGRHKRMTYEWSVRGLGSLWVFYCLLRCYNSFDGLPYLCEDAVRNVSCKRYVQGAHSIYEMRILMCAIQPYPTEDYPAVLKALRRTVTSQQCETFDV